MIHQLPLITQIDGSEFLAVDKLYTGIYRSKSISSHNFMNSFIPGISGSVQSTGIPGIDGGKWSIYNGLSVGFDASPTLTLTRKMKGSSAPTTGPGGAYPYSNLWAYTETNYNDIGYEWGVVSWMNNAANASTGSQNVSLAGTVVKQAWGVTSPTTGATGNGTTATVTFSGGATIPVGHTVWVQGITPSSYNGKFKVTASSPGSVTFANTTTSAQTVAGTVMDISIGPTWAGNLNCTDQTGESDPIASCIGVEIDNYSTAGTTDANRQRVIAQLASAGGHVGNGLLFTTKSGAVLDRAASFPNANVGIGFDFSNGSFASPVLALASNQSISFDTVNSTGAFTRSLSFNGSTLGYTTSSGNVFSISDAGAVKASAYTGNSSINIFSATGTGLYLGYNGSTQWGITTGTGGGIGPLVDNTYNIGATTYRVKTGYFVSLGNSSTPVSNAYISNLGSFTSPVTTGYISSLIGGSMTLSGSLSVTSNVTASSVSISQLQLTKLTVGTLPACNSSLDGTLMYVSDALSPTYNAIVTGGGTVKTTVLCNGTNWTAH